MNLNRQELVIGKKNQELLKKTTVAVVGVGALGSVVAELLARAGIGKLLLIDRDTVEESNIQRQVLYTKKDVGTDKVEAAKKFLENIGTKCRIEIHPVHLSNENITLLHSADCVVDGSDNFAVRFLLNDWCKQQKKPWIFGSAIQKKGLAALFLPEGPCFRCLFHEKQATETCASAGVLNSITTLIGTLQVSLLFDLLLEKEVIADTLYTATVNPFNIHKVSFKKQDSCPSCKEIFPSLTQPDTKMLLKFCGKDKWQFRGKPEKLGEMARKWEKIASVSSDEQCIRCKEVTLYADGRAVISAKSQKEAEKLYSEYIGN